MQPRATVTARFDVNPIKRRLLLLLRGRTYLHLFYMTLHGWNVRSQQGRMNTLRAPVFATKLADIYC